MRASASWIFLRSGGSTRVSVVPRWRTLTRRVSCHARTAMPLRYRSARRARQLPHPLAGGRRGYLSDSARRRSWPRRPRCYRMWLRGMGAKRSRSLHGCTGHRGCRGPRQSGA